MGIQVKEAGLWGSSKPNVSESSPAYHGVDIRKLNKVRELMKTHAPSVTLAADPISEDWFHVVHNHPKHGPAVMSYGADILDHALSDNDPYDFVGQMKKLHKEQSQKTASINSMALHVSANAAARMMTPKVAGLNADVICRVLGLDD